MRIVESILLGAENLFVAEGVKCRQEGSLSLSLLLLCFSFLLLSVALSLLLLYLFLFLLLSHCYSLSLCCSSPGLSPAVGLLPRFLSGCWTPSHLLLLLLFKAIDAESKRDCCCQYQSSCRCSYHCCCVCLHGSYWCICCYCFFPSLLLKVINVMVNWMVVLLEMLAPSRGRPGWNEE